MMLAIPSGLLGIRRGRENSTCLAEVPLHEDQHGKSYDFYAQWQQVSEFLWRKCYIVIEH